LLAQRTLRFVVFVVAVVAAFTLPGTAWATGNGPTYTPTFVTTPPTIDGTIGDTEWSDAAGYSVLFGNSPATVRFEETATTLYVGVTVQDLAPGPAPEFDVLFDNNHNGVKDNGDDNWGSFVGGGGEDFYSISTTESNPDTADLSTPGTQDTVAAATSASGNVVFEIAHPLCSSDTAHDVCLHPGDTAGIDFQYEPDTAPGVFSDAPGPSFQDPSDNWANLTMPVDTTAPSVSITAPQADTTLSGTVPVTADASDNVRVANVRFEFMDGATQKTYDVGNASSSPYTVPLDTTTLPNTTAGTLYAIATDGAGNSTQSAGVPVTIANVVGSLTATIQQDPGVIGAPANVNLTANGNEDWAIWGYANGGTSTSLAPDVRKAGGSGISNLTSIDTTPNVPLRGLGQFAEPFTFDWSDGDSPPPDPSKPATGGIQHDGEPPTSIDPVGDGFSFTVPADTVTRTLRIWVSTDRADGILTASLSDGSAADYVDTLPKATETRAGLYTITYAAAHAGQTLHVSWIESNPTDCGSTVCNNAAVFAVALSEPTASSAQVSLTGDSSVGMSGSDDPIADIPLRAFEQPQDGVTPAPINGLPINGLPINGLPINGLPINGLPINGLPINGLPINGLPINGLPINGLPINGLPINGLPINGLPLTTPGGWQALLANTSLAGLPLQTITLQQVLALTPAPEIKLGDLDLSASALGKVTIGALALGATPINGLGLSADDLASLVAWCKSVDTTNSGGCTDAAIGNQSLFALSLSGAPINGLPINGLPINGLPINGLPINGLPINGLDLSASPINGLPINGLTLAGTPINGLSLADIVAAHAPDGSASPFGAIHISDLADQSHIDCTKVDCTTATLADAAAANALGSATLADLGSAALGPLTVGDLHYYDDLTIGDLLPSLVGTNATLGDVIALLIDRADVPWETLSPRLLSVFDPQRPELQLTAAVSLGGGGNVPATVQLTLPDGFDLVPGSATVGETPLPDPTIKGDTATFETALPADVTDTLHFSAYSGTDVGPAQATITVASGAVSQSATASFTVKDSFESREVPTITPDVAVQQSAIASSGDVDYYRIPMPPAGTRLTVHLTNLPADYDLALYSNETTSVRTGGTSGVPLQDGTVPDTEINLQGAANAQLQPTALQDVPDPGIPVVQVSDNRGTDDEDVGMVSPGGDGYATIAVYGYNGASSPHPYSLRVKTQAPVSLSCPPRTFPAANDGTAGTLPDIGSLPSNLNTLLLVNEKRLGDTYGATAESSVVDALNVLANDSEHGVSGAVLPVEAVAQSQYDAWDKNPCDVTAANSVANAIADEVDSIKATHPNLKYVVFAGGDDEIPFFRIPDLSLIANESGFAGAFGANEYYGSLASGDLLTDDPYLDTRPIPASGRQIFIPDLIGGRLVEKPDQIVGAINDFEAANGALQRTSAFVSGYDFVSDGSQEVADRLGSILGTANVKSLISPPNWSKSDLLTNAFPASGPATINDWNGHYDNYQALPADGNQSTLVTTADLNGPYALSGGIFFTMGCHAGFQTTDAIVGSSAPDALDWAEKFATSGTQFVGNTGFGLGNTDSIAFSEELMADFAGNLDGSVSIGQALADAKQTYYLGRTAFSSYDEKTLAEAELYGLPMYGVGTSPQPLGAAQTAALPAAPDPVNGASSSTSPSEGTLTAVGFGDVQSAPFAVTPDFESHSGDHGDYLTNGDQVQAPNYRPLQPYVTLPASRPDATAHGVLVDGLTSADVTPFNPDNVRPTLDLSANEPEPQFTDEAWPTKIPTLVSLQGTSGFEQDLNLATGQFFTDPTTSAGVERKWTQISGRVTYSDSTDFVPPTIDSIVAYIANGTVAFSGRFSDLTDTGATGTVALAQVVYDVDNGGTWVSLPLQRDAATGMWSGGAPFAGTHVQYFVEACDLAGNCGYSSNKGRYFDAQPLPAATGSITITPDRGPDQGTWYKGPVDVTASAPNDASVEVSVDGGAFAPASGPITLNGEGAHLVQARDSAGNATSAAFLVDAVGPTITHAVDPATPDGANGWYVTAPTVTFTCADDVSGVASGTCAIDGSSPASNSVTLGESASSQSIAASATDNAGNVGHDAVSLKVDLVDPTVPKFTGITDGTIYPINDLPPASAIGCTSTDSASGVAICVVTGYGAGLGSHTLTATATDNAGRTSTSTLTYTVGYQVGNVLPPVTAPSGDQTNEGASDLQAFKIKSTIPVKFRLYLDAAKTMLLTSPPAGSTAKITFAKSSGSTDSSDTATLLTATADSGGEFRWTGASDYQYVYNLRTASSAAGTYFVTLTLYASDGTTVLAKSARQYFVLR